MTTHAPQDKRQQILSAAEKLIAEVGFQGLSMQKLAKEAGVAAGTIYRYFDDKDHLIDDVRVLVTQRVADAVQDGVNDSDPIKQRYRTMWLNICKLATVSPERPTAENKETQPTRVLDMDRLSYRSC
ncbi:TetR/AcrR family transcriptional regulator, partial [Vibrio chagasii]|uniref:TetR/AcrR family transcriptional regulator n=1 Tax=Vibrio chagasii TaxID=170679 RepID=UPI0020A35381